MTRKYLPTFSELIDRLSITQMKECKIPQHRETYSKEIKDIVHDIQQIINEEKLVLTAENIRDIIIVALYNSYIWTNEANHRAGIKEGNNLEISHSFNGIRNTAKNKIQSAIGGRTDLKIDNIQAHPEWIPSW